MRSPWQILQQTARRALWSGRECTYTLNRSCAGSTLPVAGARHSARSSCLLQPLACTRASMVVILTVPGRSGGVNLFSGLFVHVVQRRLSPRSPLLLG